MLSNSGKALSNASDKKNALFKKYTQKSTVGSLCATLEAVAMKGTNLLHICSTSHAIKDVRSKKSNCFGSEELTYETLQELIKIYEFEFQEQFINHSLMHDDYIVAIEIPKNKLSEYAMNQYDLHQQKEITVYRYTEDWTFNRLVALRSGLYSDKEILAEQSGPKQWSQKPFFNSDLNRYRYGFQFAAGTSKLPKGLKSNVKLISEIEQLYNDYRSNFIPTCMDQNESSGDIIPVNKHQILCSIAKVNQEQENVYNKLLNIEFPLIVEIEDLCFVLPNACQYYLQLLYSQKYESELIEEKKYWGDQFENLVFSALDLFGYEVNNPNNNEPLLNFNIVDENDRINDKPRSFELDAAGFTEQNSVIIECKHWDIGYNYYKRRSIEKRKRDFQRQLEKFHHKIELIRKDENYSFLTRDKKLDAYMVTLHPEPINEYKGIKVIPFTKFTADTFCENPNESQKQELKLKKREIITKRKYQDGNILIGIDYTKMIMNPYGIKHICIEPENELKSYIYIGDGIVEELDQEELSLKTSIDMKVIIDLIEDDIPYLKSKKIKKGKKVRYQIYTKDPLFSSYYLRFIRRMK
jgi:hypothetical protein